MKRYSSFNEWAAMMALRQVDQRRDADPSLVQCIAGDGLGIRVFAARSAEEAEALYARREREDRPWF